MPSGVYQRGPSKAHPFKIRTLRPGESVPEGEPRRYVRKGYIYLRWKVGIRQYVEVREHRVIAGVVTDDHVHHVNHDRRDNRPENLLILTASEHLRHHGHKWRKVIVEEAAVLYRDGWTLPRLAERYGCHNVTVLRALRRHGVELRPVGYVPTETRSRVMRAIHAKRTPERQAEIMRKAWATRRGEVIRRERSA